MPVAFHPLRLRGVGERGLWHAWGFQWGDSGGDESLQSFLLPPWGLCRAAGCRKGMPEAAGGERGRDRERTGGRRRWAGVGRAGGFFLFLVFI